MGREVRRGLARWDDCHAATGLFNGITGSDGQSKRESKRQRDIAVAKGAATLDAMYCLYGAQSPAQFYGCVHHVQPERIAHMQTPAARFARAEPLICGYGSGPYCSAREAVRITREISDLHLPVRPGENLRFP